jgi:hypothetical protein
MKEEGRKMGEKNRIRIGGGRQGWRRRIAVGTKQGEERNQHREQTRGIRIM